jgi:hypothetical protein
MASYGTAQLYAKQLTTEQGITISGFLRVETREATGEIVSVEAFQIILAARNRLGTVTGNLQTWTTNIGGAASGIAFEASGAGEEIRILAMTNAEAGRRILIVSGWFEV